MKQKFDVTGMTCSACSAHVEKAVRIKQFIDTHQPKSVVIAGGGFIGLEMAENLRELPMNAVSF